MLTENSEQVFLPVWRDGRLIFFTNIVNSSSQRLGYFAAAATAAGKTDVTRTGKAPINADQLAFCQKIADDGISLQKFFAAMGAGNLGLFTDAIQAKSLPYPENTSPLIYTCLYLDFLRKYAVDTEIIRMYSNSPVKQRFHTDRSVGIYKILSARLQSDTAEKLIDADLKQNKKLHGASMMIANLLRECAIVKFDLGKFAEAEDYMLRAAKLHNTADKWRRLADFAQASGDRKKTIEYFLKAVAFGPLPAPSALNLGRCLVEEGDFEQAREYVQQAAKVFEKPAKVLMERINAAN